MGVPVILFALLASQVVSPAWPGARSGHAMGYDARRGAVMVYGGDADSLLWAWNGIRWRSFGGAAPNPGRRKHMKLVYDPSRDRLVLFGGGTKTSMLGDTWEWDGKRWKQVTTEGPGERMAYAMAWDPARRRIVLFGGVGPARVPMNDTWEWDGRRWTRIATEGPPPRLFAELTAGTGAGELLLVGGQPRSGPVFRDAWTLNEGTWRLLPDSGPGRTLGALTRDPLTDEPLWIGGKSDSASHGDGWRRTGGAWLVLPGGGLPERIAYDAALDTKRKRVVVFGGAGSDGDLDDLYEWDGRVWTRIRRDP